jgi:hypothetical protein
MKKHIGLRTAHTILFTFLIPVAWVSKLAEDTWTILTDAWRIYKDIWTEVDYK